MTSTSTDTENAALQFALKILSRRDHFEKELMTKLIRKGFEPEICEIIMEKLRNRNYVDDLRTVQQLKREILMKKKGPGYLKQKLFEKAGKDFSLSVNVRELYSEDEERSLLRDLISRLPESLSREKKIRKLITRGFSYNLIKGVLNGHYDS